MSATLKSSKKSENQWKVATNNNPNIIATLVAQSYRAYIVWADPHNEPFYLRPLSQAVDGRYMVARNPESLYRVYSFLYFRSCHTIFLAVGIPQKNIKKIRYTYSPGLDGNEVALGISPVPVEARRVCRRFHWVCGRLIETQSPDCSQGWIE